MCVSTTHSNRDLPDQSQLSVKNIQQGICIFLQNTVTNVTTLKTSKLLITKVQKKLDVEWVSAIVTCHQALFFFSPE